MNCNNNNQVDGLSVFCRLSAIFCIVLVLGLAILGRGPAEAASKTAEQPILRVETGRHTASINRIDVDAAGKYLVTASLDKTARVWEINTGRLLRTLRPPQGEGDEGKLYAAALSPDGSLVACGGYTGLKWDNNICIYIFDRVSGRMIHRISGLPNVINRLTFSPDNMFLAATIGGANGLRVYRASDWSRVYEDKSYGDSSYGADFDDRGRLVTSCDDGFIRLYDAVFRLTAKKKTPGGSRPYQVDFSPDGDRIAVGFADSAKVNVLSGRDLAFLYAPDTSEVDNGNLGRIQWSTDGRDLYAGGRYDQEGGCPLIKWPDQGRGSFRAIPAAQDIIMDIRALPYGGAAFGAGDPAWGEVDRIGRKNIGIGPATADFRGMFDVFTFSYNGDRMGFGYQFLGKKPAVFSIRDRDLLLDQSSSNGLTGPILKAPGLEVADWKNNYNPKVNGRPLKIDQYERSRSLALTPDGAGFILGTDWYLRFFDKSGREKWSQEAPDVAWAVNIAPNGKVCAAAFADGTIRWYRVSDGQELLAFFPHPDRKRWIMWTPSGYYDCSPGAEDLIGWHLNRGKDQAADFFPASRFRADKYRPNVIALILETLDEDQALTRTDEADGRPRIKMSIQDNLPPVLTIVSPDNGVHVSRSRVTIRYQVRSEDPVTEVRTLLDGRPADDQRGVILQGKPLSSGEYELQVDIPGRDVRISLLAKNKNGFSEPDSVSLVWAGAQKEFSIKPKLYVLAVGVSDYLDDELDLRFAAKDARDLARVLERQKGLLYMDVQTRLLTDEKAGRDALLDGLEWLERQTTSKDVAVLFMAGHGVRDDRGDYNFLPHGADLNRLRRTGLPFFEITRTVENLAGKAICFVDTCHSGSLMGGRRGKTDINAVINELISAETGAVVFSSSTGNQYSLEDEAWNNGAFTKALVEGLSGEACYTDKGKITVAMLEYYLSERVKELTKGRQTPTTAKPPDTPDFPIAIAR